MDERNRDRPYPAEKARQGYIVLNTPTRRAIFFGGLVAFVVIVVVVSLVF